MMRDLRSGGPPDYAFRTGEMYCCKHGQIRNRGSFDERPASLQKKHKLALGRLML